MGNKPGLFYKNLIINFHHHHKRFNAVCKSTVNLAFLRIQLGDQEYRKLNRVLRIKVSGKKQDGAKRNNG